MEMTPTATREDDGVDHRLQQLGAHVLALLGVVGEAVEHLLQVTGLLAGRHHGAEQLIEHMGKAASESASE
jgi:hypothetical protein